MSVASSCLFTLAALQPCFSSLCGHLLKAVLVTVAVQLATEDQPRPNAPLRDQPYALVHHLSWLCNLTAQPSLLTYCSLTSIKYLHCGYLTAGLISHRLRLHRHSATEDNDARTAPQLNPW